MIDVINLKKKFGDTEVLKGIDVTINKGDIVVVIGPSGSGKSTFLRCLNCMEDPTGGQIIFNGVDIADMRVDINVHRRHMGMVFQHFNLFNNKTVLQNIMLAPVYVRCQDLRKAKKKKTKKSPPLSPYRLSENSRRRKRELCFLPLRWGETSLKRPLQQVAILLPQLPGNARHKWRRRRANKSHAIPKG